MGEVAFDVVCAGFACWDVSLYVDHHPGEDEKISAQALFESPGGPALTACGTVGSLGGKTAMITYLGNDSNGESCHRALISKSVNTHPILWNHQATPIATVYVKPNGTRSVVNFKGKEPQLPLDNLKETLTKATVILIDPHWPRLAEFVVDFAKERNIPTILDAGSLSTNCLKLSHEVDWCVCSKSFAESLSKSMDTDLILASLISHYKRGVLTLGDKGCIAWNENQTEFYPTKTITPIDTTGAGDVFHGAFAYALSQHKSLPECCQFANKAATTSCLKKGSFQGIPTQNEIQSLFPT